MTERNYEIGGRRGYVTSSPGRSSRVVIEISDGDVSLSVREARDLTTLLGLLLREAGEWTPIWASVLGHNLVTAGALEQARERGQAEAVLVIASRQMERSEREAEGLVVLACPTCERGPLTLDSTCERCYGTGAWLVEVRPLLANLYAAGSLAYATERVGSGRYCRVCDAPTPRESWERTVDGCPACRLRASQP